MRQKEHKRLRQNDPDKYPELRRMTSERMSVKRRTESRGQKYCSNYCETKRNGAKRTFLYEAVDKRRLRSAISKALPISILYLYVVGFHCTYYVQSLCFTYQQGSVKIKDIKDTHQRIPSISYTIEPLVVSVYQTEFHTCMYKTHWLRVSLLNFNFMCI